MLAYSFVGINYKSKKHCPPPPLPRTMKILIRHLNYIILIAEFNNALMVNLGAWIHLHYPLNSIHNLLTKIKEDWTHNLSYDSPLFLQAFNTN